MAVLRESPRMTSFLEMVSLVDAFVGIPTNEDFERIARHPFKAKDVESLFETRKERKQMNARPERLRERNRIPKMEEARKGSDERIHEIIRSEPDALGKLWGIPRRPFHE